MKQKIDKSDAKDGWWERVFNPLVVSDMKEIAVMLFLVVMTVISCIIGVITAWDQHESQKAEPVIPAEQQQPMIEIPIERTICVKPAEGYCMEYRTNRIRTP